MDYAIEVHDLCKVIDNQPILSNVNMKVKKGEIYGFLGANGAGKTTLMKVLFRILKPTSGTIKLLSQQELDSSNNVFCKIGSIIEMPVFYLNLTARQNLELHCDYMGIDYKANIEKCLQMAEISDTGNKKVKNFSLGMKQRLAIARAILTDPEILILDEPINGLDPKGISDMRELLIKINKERGTTILISSHILSEMEKIANTIGIINNGIILEEVSMSDITAKNINLEEYYLQLLEGVRK
ncbi:ATP-binding cassette domain-containing protein [Clostridium frigidicarnis]|uniref:ABC-2 type transport system ATP-binding protein n=1 Tax=Clostridium frigidicarnis TaxID=84698 RepID=A0A1I1A861_9CLOT|nr:ATP-binding cassette domain-containing protein [Clostridium frigidicarnis]SFB33586.1 ABC-2 type transport system ATP-binding protein [Clostridium frigidicarnis]